MQRTSAVRFELFGRADLLVLAVDEDDVFLPIHTRCLAQPDPGLPLQNCMRWRPLRG